MKKLTYVLSFVFVLATVLVVVGCTESSVSASTNDTYVTLDINPSIELIVSPKEIVIYANPLNEDGEILLENLDLIGLPLSEATDLIIAEAIILGFIDVDSEEVFVSVSAISNDPEIGDRIRDRLKEHINDAFLNRAMMGRAQDKGFTPEFTAEAESYGVTPRFLFLAKSATLVDDTLTLEDALALPQADLLEMLETAKQANREVAQALKDEFFAARQLIFDEYLPQIQDLEAQIAVVVADEGDTTALQAELDALVAAFHDEVSQLRDDYHLQTVGLRSQIQAQRELRMQEHMSQVEAFMNRLQNRKDQMQDEIEEFQGRRP